VASTYDAFVATLVGGVVDSLPVVTDEIGDTWIHGIASDPIKTMQYREIVRARTACVQSGKCDIRSPQFQNFDFLLAKLPEHTWGMDVKTFLADSTNWSNQQFQKAKNGSNFQLIVNSWIEQRAYISAAINSLGNDIFANTLNQRLAALKPYTPSTQGLSPVNPSMRVFKAGLFDFGFDPDTGAITYLYDKANTKQWVDSSANSGLFRFSYQTYSQSDYSKFFAEYLLCSDCPWAPLDFGKPNMPGNSTITKPLLKELYYGTNETFTLFLQHLTMPTQSVTENGAPRDIYVKITVPANGTTIDVDYQIFGKTSTRLVEALWVSFVPSVTGASGDWELDKLGEWVDAGHIAKNGSKHLHVVNSARWTDDKKNTFQVNPIDAPLISVGYPSAFPTPVDTDPVQASGVHVNLYNNIWGTNYIMWYPFIDADVNTKYRFQLVVS